MSTERRRAWSLRRPLAAIAVGGLLAVGGAVAISAPADADPSANTWYQLRLCESSNNYSINTGNGYYGAYQFDLPTWRSVRGTGYPNQNPPSEQDYRALALYRMRGWEPWTCAQILGLREDSDAGSGVWPPRPGGPTTKAPPWPGVQYFFGNFGPHIRQWQLQMRKRGYPFQGTGYFGTTTLKYVKILQQRNGLHVVGFIGPKTWAAAWTGR
jgi:hypothetical protein